jgi:hypothetical protein
MLVDGEQKIMNHPEPCCVNRMAPVVIRIRKNGLWRTQSAVNCCQK